MNVRPWAENLIQMEPPGLIGSGCNYCDRRTFPAREVCPRCHAVDGQQIITLSTRGTLFSYTVIRQAPPGVEVPYVLGYVDLPDDDVRVLSKIGDVDPDNLALGLELTVELSEFGRDEEGVRMGWQFIPATKAAIA